MSPKQSKTNNLAPKKNRSLSLECKLNIIRDFATKTKIRELAKKYDVPVSTIRTIIKCKRTIQFEELVDLTRQLSLDLDSDVDPHNQKLPINNLIKTESLDPVKSEDQMTIANLTEGLSLIENGLHILEQIDSNEGRVSATKQQIKDSLRCYNQILQEKTQKVTRQTTLLDFEKLSISK